ncbi:MAG: spore maturation protein [Bacillota bacterium]
MSEYIIPILILILFLYCVAKKIPVFDLFVSGGREALPLVASVFPYLVGIFFMISLAEVSGLIAVLESFLAPLFEFIGVPSGVTKLVIFRPFSGSGSLAILEEIFETFGVDSYEGRVASCVCGAGETVFYLACVYFSGVGITKLGKSIGIAILCTFVGVIFCALFCKIM